MFSEAALRIELHRGSQITVLDIQSDRALIGSGAHCDVRLAPDEAAVEQLLVEALDEDVYARARTVEPPCLLNGAPFLEGRLPPSSMLELGSVVVCIKFAPRLATENKKKRAASTPAVVQALCLLGLSLGFYFVLTQTEIDNSALAGALAPPPELTIASEPCPEVDRTALRSLALEAQVAAENKRERAPFYARDGLSAVTLFERAASCSERAGDATEAAAAHAEAALMRAHLHDEQHVRHVRLERLLYEQKFDEARREAQLASELVLDQSRPYAQWLSATMREGRLRAKASKATP